MDIVTISLLVGIIITVIIALVGGFFAGFIGALILGTLVMLGLAFVPTTPIIPIWIALLIVTLEIILVAFKVAGAFGLGKGQGD